MSITVNHQKIPLHVAVDIAFADLESRLKGEKNLSTPFLVGSPGGGKTQSIGDRAKRMNLGFVSRNIGLMRIEETGGVPEFFIEDEELRTRWSVPELITEIRQKAKIFPAVIVLLDDWHIAILRFKVWDLNYFRITRSRGTKSPKYSVYLSWKRFNIRGESFIFSGDEQNC